MTSKAEKPELPPVIIERLSHEGRGVTHINGKTVFLHGALPDESVKFRYYSKHRQFAEGGATEILKASPHRVVPKCTAFGVCGGCALQHLDYTQQLLHKENTLIEQLKHIGGITPAQILPPLVGSEWGYRHKARLAVRYLTAKGGALVGFREQANPRFVTPLSTCSILHPRLSNALPALQQLINSLSIPADIPQLEVAQGEITTAIIFRHLKPFIPLDYELLKQFGQDHEVAIFTQPKGLDSVHLLWRPELNDTLEETRELLYYELPDYQIKLYFHPTDFTQVNAFTNKLMVKAALELLEVQPEDHILDLFCGLGNFSLPLARLGHKVIGIEGTAAMVERAKFNAKYNNLLNTEFYTADLENISFDEAYIEQKFAKILIDPPRCGASHVVANIERCQAQRILYVSCNAATLARDASVLKQKGYELTTVRIIDMFGHTSHSEAMALFVRSN